jgi:hypothetical protein
MYLFNFLLSFKTIRLTNLVTLPTNVTPESSRLAHAPQPDYALDRLLSEDGSPIPSLTHNPSASIHSSHLFRQEPLNSLFIASLFLSFPLIFPFPFRSLTGHPQPWQSTAQSRHHPNNLRQPKLQLQPHPSRSKRGPSQPSNHSTSPLPHATQM